MDIQLPRGTKAAYLEGLNPLGEQEVLLPRGSEFEIVSTSTESITVRGKTREIKRILVKIVQGAL